MLTRYISFHSLRSLGWSLLLALGATYLTYFLSKYILSSQLSGEAAHGCDAGKANANCPLVPREKIQLKTAV